MCSSVRVLRWGKRCVDGAILVPLVDDAPVMTAARSQRPTPNAPTRQHPTHQRFNGLSSQPKTRHDATRQPSRSR